MFTRNPSFASLSSVQSPPCPLLFTNTRVCYRTSSLRQISSTDKANLGIATHRGATSTVGWDLLWGFLCLLGPKTFDIPALSAFWKMSNTCTPPVHPTACSGPRRRVVVFRPCLRQNRVHLPTVSIKSVWSKCTVFCLRAASLALENATQSGDGRVGTTLSAIQATCEDCPHP